MPGRFTVELDGVKVSSRERVCQDSGAGGGMGTRSQSDETAKIFATYQHFPVVLNPCVCHERRPGMPLNSEAHPRIVTAPGQEYLQRDGLG